MSRSFGAAARVGRKLPLALTAVLSVALSAGAARAQPPQAPPVPYGKSGTTTGVGQADVKAQGSYSLGVLLGGELHRAGLNASSISFDKVLQGLKDVTSGKVQPSDEDREHLNALVMRSQAAAAQSNKAAARKFLAQNAHREGVKTTASGLQYKVLSAGSGASPRPTDRVLVNYRGTLLDGTEFDSSYKRGQPASFPVNGVIPGWTEALVMMKPGAKWKLYIPPELAYGDRSPAPVIPPGSLLEFDVELLKVTPAGSPAGAEPNARGGTGG